jgi:hypothetical protein
MRFVGKEVEHASITRTLEAEMEYGWNIMFEVGDTD